MDVVNYFKGGSVGYFYIVFEQVRRSFIVGVIEKRTAVKLDHKGGKMAMI